MTHVTSVAGAPLERWRRLLRFVRSMPDFIAVSTIVWICTLAYGPEASAKVPGATHCYNEICRRVLTLNETAARIGKTETVTASFYGAPGRDAYNPRAETSSGEVFRSDRDDNVASPIYPDGTRLLIWNPATGHAASVRVNNAGPYMAGRMLDTSEHLARRLGFLPHGLARLNVVVIGSPTGDEADYRRGRVYVRVPGYLGRFGSLQLAMLADTSAVLALIQVPADGGLVATGDAKPAGDPKSVAENRSAATPSAKGPIRRTNGMEAAGGRARIASVRSPAALAAKTLVPPLLRVEKVRASANSSDSGRPRSAPSHCVFGGSPTCN